MFKFDLGQATAMRTSILTILFLFNLINSSHAQALQEVEPPENIKTVIFKGPRTGDQFPLITLGESMRLSFDDLYADEQDYYYRLVHCNHDWTPSALPKNRYLKGVDNLRITTYQNSVATLQPYTHYTLDLPNAETGMQVTGNYVLQIFDQKDELILSRKFIVYAPVSATALAVKRSRDFEFADTHQRLELSINTQELNLQDPRSQVKVWIIQNSYLPGALNLPGPQFTSNNTLIYRYDKESRFEAGNEYRYLDTKEIRTGNASVARVALLNNRYHHYLFTSAPRDQQAYTYFPDINGDFEISSINSISNSPDNEADYSFVWFTLEVPQPAPGQRLYVYGKFNNYRLTPENEMTLNERTGLFEAPVLLKQGIYNYKFVLTSPEGNVMPNAICGNFWPTENEYLAVVYYRGIGELYDRVIGIANASSTTISN